MDIQHTKKKTEKSFATFLFVFFFFFQKLAAHRENVLMNEALMQCELLTALETCGTNSFAARDMLRSVPQMSQTPEHFERVTGLCWYWEVSCASNESVL